MFKIHQRDVGLQSSVLRAIQKGFGDCFGHFGLKVCGSRLRAGV